MTIDMKSPPEATQQGQEQEQEQEQEQLPKETFFESLDLYQWQGFWYRPKHLKATAALRSHFQSKDDDVILASSMKTGSTWLKALCFTIMQTSRNNNINGVNENNNNYQVTEEKGEKAEDLLVKHHPAHYVRTLEVQLYTATPPPDLSGMPSPRLFHTHLPLNALPECVKRSECKIVYITRNPKDTLLSMWHFFNTLRGPAGQGPYPLEDAFDKFCDGVCHFGPFLDHVLDYWNESLKAPGKVLFLKYEEMKRDPKKEVRRLAAFMGRPIGGDQEAEEVVRRCSLERLKNLEVNKNGIDPWVGMPNSSFFRTGIVGGWKDCMTAEMSERLDRIARSKLEGTGLSFEYGV